MLRRISSGYLLINVLDLVYNFTDFRLLCDNYNPIVCCLQETMLTKVDYIIPGFNCIHLTSRDIGDEVVLSRLKLGHSYLTHSYLLKGEPPPECVTCNCRLNISHILVDCIEYDIFRFILA